jgi:hypothetical protein
MFHVKHLFGSCSGGVTAALGLLFLASFGQAAAIPDLIAALQSGDEAERLAARRELATLGPEAARPLLELAASGADPAVRRLAIGLLGDVADQNVTPFVVELLRDPSVALAAVEALQSLPGTPATAALAVALPSAPPELQVALLRALGVRGDKRSVPDVTAMVTSPDEGVRAAAAQALERLCGVAESGGEAPVRFRTIRLADASSLVEACTVLDVNRDGRLDIAGGGFWYEAPGWTPHAYREVTNDGSYANDWAEFAVDVNGDGWTDVLSGGFHTSDIAWFENPQGRDGAWQKHLAWSRGDEFYETLLMVDVDGDGQGDFLPNAGSPIRWYELRRREGAPPEFVRHDVGPEGAGHGIGYGDVNGDGGLDILTPTGWHEAPEDARDGQWAWHGEFSLGSTSVPILAHDTDGDGLADILWGSGHDYGVFRLKQTRGQGGERGWQREVLDASWSQGHAPELADLDGSGTLDLIIGKRYKAHDHDPGVDDPLCVYWYQFEAGTTHRWVVSYDDGAGVGLQQSVLDLDGDGDPDIVSACKTGLFVFEQIGSAGGP